MNPNYSARLRPLAAPVPAPKPPQAARFVELPNALSDGQPAMAPLVTRAELTAHGFTVHINQNYAFSGVAPDSYEMLDASPDFAQHGRLTANYPATTDTIDLLIGMAVQLDGVDTVIENQTPFGGLSSQFLVFVGGEIMSIVGSKLTGNGSYVLTVARNRFGTPRQAHNAGDEVYILKQDSLLKLTHPQIQAGNSAQFKIAMQSRGQSSDLSTVGTSTVPIAGTVFNLPAPSGLTVNGQTINAGYVAGTSMDIDWVLPAVTGIDMSRAYTLLDFIAAGYTTESVQIPWPLNSTSFTYLAQALSGTGPSTTPNQITLQASIVAVTDWQQITGPTATIQIFKH